MKTYDCVVIGIGRVGLPLSISMASKGIKVVGLDINKDVIESVNNKIFPFKEEGYEELIKKVDFNATSDYSVIQESEHIIVTVGTPLMGHIETDLSYIISVLESIMPYFQKGHHLILRSTIAPNTSIFVKDFIEQRKNFTLGKDFFMSFCPERMAEGKSLVELETLPQIIGTIEEKSKNISEKFFSRFVPEVLHSNFISAELVKLFNNISRYVYFATANQFAIIAEQYGANIHEVISMSNYKYPRGVIPNPGLTAGTCLRKDFGMINENIPFTDLLLSAWKVNEFMPKFLVDGVKSRVALKGKKVSVLGYTFKQDVDDVRDSLVPKLLRYLYRENPREINVHEPNLGENLDENYKNINMEDAINETDVLIFAINHSEFKINFESILKKLNKKVIIADLWNISSIGGIFFSVEEYFKTIIKE